MMRNLRCRWEVSLFGRKTQLTNTTHRHTSTTNYVLIIKFIKHTTVDAHMINTRCAYSWTCDDICMTNDEDKIQWFDIPTCLSCFRIRVFFGIPVGLGDLRDYHWAKCSNLRQPQLKYLHSIQYPPKTAWQFRFWIFTIISFRNCVPDNVPDSKTNMGNFNSPIKLVFQLQKRWWNDFEVPQLPSGRWVFPPRCHRKDVPCSGAKVPMASVSLLSSAHAPWAPWAQRDGHGESFLPCGIYKTL